MLTIHFVALKLKILIAIKESVEFVSKKAKFSFLAPSLKKSNISPPPQMLSQARQSMLRRSIVL